MIENVEWCQSGLARNILILIQINMRRYSLCNLIIFCYFGLNAKFQNPRTTLSRRKVREGVKNKKIKIFGIFQIEKGGGSPRGQFPIKKK